MREEELRENGVVRLLHTLGRRTSGWTLLAVGLGWFGRDCQSSNYRCTGCLTEKCVEP